MLAVYILLAIVVLYAVWRIFYIIWNKLRGLGVEHPYYSSDLFDIVFASALLGAIVSRVSWMITNASLYKELPWALLPYYRIEETGEVLWFTFLPWNAVNVQEGMYFGILLAVSAGVTIARLLPTIQLVRGLKLEKRGIVKAMIVQIALALGLVLAYYASIWAYLYIKFGVTV